MAPAFSRNRLSDLSPYLQTAGRNEQLSISRQGACGYNISIHRSYSNLSTCDAQFLFKHYNYYYERLFTLWTREDITSSVFLTVRQRRSTTVAVHGSRTAAEAQGDCDGRGDGRSRLCDRFTNTRHHQTTFQAIDSVDDSTQAGHHH